VREAIKRWLEWQRWSLRLAWLQATDRWFIFRDAPLHVVERFAGYEDSRDAGLQHAIGEARLELSLRRHRIQHEIMNNVAEKIIETEATS
jgi:hypothetical protein